MHQDRVVIVGAGIGGLAAAVRLAQAGCDVTVVEAAGTPGGKMRTFASEAGPVDAGPTVLTMRPVFEDLFAAAGTTLAAHVTLDPLPVLARHVWADGHRLDLFPDHAESGAAIGRAFGAQAAADFLAFAARARRLFDAFDAPMMQDASPSVARLAAVVAGHPRLILDMAPHRTLAGLLQGAFASPHLRQLFGRYATYVGGSPYGAPGLLALVAEAEMRGVWAVRGGMHRLAATITDLARARGARFLYDTRAQRIEVQGGRTVAVHTTAGRLPADAVLFNGDPRALVEGLLGDGVRPAVPRKSVEPRSLSAWVHAFAARPEGADLSYHTVFFGDDPRAEFGPLAAGQTPTDATLYVCAQDRALTPAGTGGAERFEIILNAPPAGTTPETAEEIAACQTRIFARLGHFGLRFDPVPGPGTLTTPQGFARAFPASRGSLYGKSPHGMTASLSRPRAASAVPGLFLCGGGTHPGAGVPMAALSGRHAAAAIMTDLTLRRTSRPAATPGGMSTASATTGRVPSR